MDHLPPCAAWAEKLALRREDLSVEERAMLDMHLESCRECAVAYTDYQFLDVGLRALAAPVVQPLPRLSPQFFSESELRKEVLLEQYREKEVPGGRKKGNALKGQQRGTGVFLEKSLSAVAVACLVIGALLLFGVRYVVSGTADTPGSTLLTYKGQRDIVSAVAWSPDEKEVASASWDHSVQVWNAKTGALQLMYKGHSDIVDAVVWSPDGGEIASASWDHSVQVWNAKTGALLLKYEGHSDSVSSLSWSPDGREIASGGWDHIVEIWDAKTGVLLRQFNTEEIVNAVAWSPDGHTLAAVGRGYGIREWDVLTGESLLTYCGYANSYYCHDAGVVVNTLSWSPDGKMIVSGSRDGIVLVWNAKTGETIRVYSGHTGEVSALSWSPDGQEIASGSWDHTVQIWKVKTGEMRLIYRGHDDNVSAVAWSKDGRWMVSGGWDNRVLLWRVN